MNRKVPEDDLDNISMAQQLLVQIHGSWVAQAVYVACELKLPEMLSSGPSTSQMLASQANVDPMALKRLLRALTTVGVVEEIGKGLFSLTRKGVLLTEDHPESIRSWIIWWATNLWQAWGYLLDSVRTGQSARKLLEGVEGFSHLDKDPAQAAVFNQALVELTRLTAKQVVSAYDFSRFETVMDVGGGYGELLLTILKSNPTLQGILFDRPHALEGAKRHFEEQGFIARCDFQVGDFFEVVPSGADAYVLKSVIHDWNDERSTRILSNCREAMGRNGTLLLVERVLPRVLRQTPEHREVARSDLTMLVALGAAERTENQFRRLLKTSGFQVKKNIPIGMTFSIIEASPA